MRQQTREEEALGVWGSAFLASLKRNDPEQYHQLKVTGKLESTAQSRARWARDRFQETLSALMESQGPAPVNPLEWDHWMRGLTNQAREATWPLVLVPRPEDREEAATSLTTPVS